MPITDNLMIRIKAEAGQSVITDNIAGLVVDTGAGTVTQMDDATYGRFWRLTGGAKSAALSGMGEWMNVNSTTIAMRFRISNRAANYSRFAIMGSNSDSGLMIGNAGTSTGGLRVGVQVAGSNIGSVGPAAYTAGTLMTAVLRFVEGATDAYDAWYTTPGRVGTDPNNSATSTTTSAYRARALLQFLTVAENLDIFDFAMLTRGVTNAEGAALADDIRGTLYPTSGASSQINATTDDITVSGASYVSPVSQINATLDDVVFSGGSISGTSECQINATLDDVVFSGESVGDTSSGTITSQEFKNQEGMLLDGLTVAKVWLIPLTDTPDFENVTTNVSGQLVLSGAAITSGVSYLLVSSSSDGAAVGVRKYTAS